MSMGNHISAIGIHLFSLLPVVFLGSCSVFLKYDECDKDEDCSGDNIVCEEGYCVTQKNDRPSADALMSDDCTRIYGVPNSEAGQENTILLGAVLPESGDLSVYGPGMSEGIELAADEINQAGGILGKNIAVLFCDSGTDSETAVRAITHIADVKIIPAVIGPAADAVVIDAYNDAAKDAGLVLVTPSAKSSALDGLVKTNHVWRMNPGDTTQGTAIASYLLDKSYEKIAVINRNDVYGNELRDAINTTLCGTFTCDETTYYSGIYDKETASTQYSQIVVDLQEFVPDITILISYFEDGAAFLKVTTEAEQEAISKFFVSDGMKSDKLLDADLSDETLCSLAGTQIGTPSGKNYDSFQLRYKAKYDTVGVYSAHAYDAVYMISYAITATNTVNPAGSDVAKGLTRLGAGDDVNAGSSDWRTASQELSENPDATINYQGASGPLDFGVSEDDEETVGPAVEAWAVDLNEKTIASLGILYSAEGVYEDALGTGDPGTGETCSKGQEQGNECKNITDCEDGHYCDLTLDPPRCMSPPSGQGVACTSQEDCEAFDADYCETLISKTCLVQGCDPVLNNCTPGFDCCDFSFMDLPALCIDSTLSGGVCQTGVTCASNDDCEEDQYCDLSLESPSCVMTPSGVGQPCTSHDDCANFQADYCDATISQICLVQGCDIQLENCSPGYKCCDFHGLADWDVSLCIDTAPMGGICACAEDQYCRDGEYCGTTTVNWNGDDMELDVCLPIEEK